ncbi:MAG: hypothetical protein KUG77_24335 [Nannocystaceae bacterium]|nr:hypothetical protein [Nannocystaceae bacterium]
MSGPYPALAGSVSCGPLRREPDGSWFFEAIYLGRDDEPLGAVAGLEDRAGLVAAQLAAALRQACDDLERWGDVVPAGRGRILLRRFERWQSGATWS